MPVVLFQCGCTGAASRSTVSVPFIGVVPKGECEVFVYGLEV